MRLILTGRSVLPAKFAHMKRREKLEAMLVESPDDAFLRYALALTYATEGNAAEASQRLARLIQSNPDYVPAYLQLAQLQLELGQPDQARPVLATGIEAARRAGDVHAEGELRGLLEQLP